jgi:hypothetical protein
MTKALKKLGIEVSYLSIIKAICYKLIANVILDGEKVEAFLPKSGMRQECPLSLLLFNIAIEFLFSSGRISQDKEIKRI